MILPARGAPTPAAMVAPGHPGGLLALVDFAEVENIATVHELYAWAGIEGDVLDPRSVRGWFHRASGGPSNIGDLAFASGPGRVDALRDLLVPALSADIPERPFAPVEREDP